MQNNTITEDVVVPRGSLAADILRMNNAGPAPSAADLKRIQQAIEEKSRSKPRRHSMDRGEQDDDHDTL